MIKAALGELLVTTLFIFVVCAQSLNITNLGHAESESLVVSALTTGFCAVALIYSFADVSGAHFNPAVTFATIVTRKTTVAKGLVYMVSQLVGSMLAMAMLAIAYPRIQKIDPVSNQTVYYTVPQQLRVTPGADAHLGSAFFMEMVLSFILVYVIFATAFDTVDSQNSVKILDERGNVTDQKHAKSMTIYTASGNSKAGFAPLSIGLTLGFLCFLGGSVSGGAFNPARVFGSAICSGDFSYYWLYLFADFVGAGLAGLLQQNVYATVKK
jgi:glycerol uptake facilitator-like aquaporin